MFNILELTKDNLIAFEVAGKLDKKDYEKLQALLEKTEKEFEYLKLLIDLHKIEGITFQALMEDFKTYFKHISEVDKVAIIGSNGIEKKLSEATDLFVSAEIKYFRRENFDLAKDWIMK